MARDPYEVVLADLRSKRDEIDKVIQTLEALRPKQDPLAAVFTSAFQAQQGSGGSHLAGMSILDAVRVVLKNKGSAMGNAELAAALKEGGLVMNSVEPANTISSVLHRASQQGSDVVRLGRGSWGLKEAEQPRQNDVAVSSADPWDAEMADASSSDQSIDDDIPF